MRNASGIACVAAAVFLVVGTASESYGAAAPNGPPGNNVLPIIPPGPAGPNIVTAADYPSLSVELREEGRVQLAVTVGADGTCKSASVVSSSGTPRLDEAAVELCKRKFTWKPASQGGRPVEGALNMNVTWQLSPIPPAAQPR